MSSCVCCIWFANSTRFSTCPAASSARLHSPGSETSTMATPRFCTKSTANSKRRIWPCRSTWTRPANWKWTTTSSSSIWSSGSGYCCWQSWTGSVCWTTFCSPWARLCVWVACPPCWKALTYRESLIWPKMSMFTLGSKVVRAKSKHWNVSVWWTRWPPRHPPPNQPTTLRPWWLSSFEVNLNSSFFKVIADLELCNSIWIQFLLSEPGILVFDLVLFVFRLATLMFYEVFRLLL